MHFEAAPTCTPKSNHCGRSSGFTLIELLVVLSIVALLVSIAAPRYMRSLERGKETSLKTSLGVMRDAIDQFAADKGRFPDTLDDLVLARYLRSVPEDPFTGLRTQWQLVAPPADAAASGVLGDVRSAAPGRGMDGRLYVDW
jgi:general secretion pathway protein G